jgi:hypothetical protein
VTTTAVTIRTTRTTPHGEPDNLTFPQVSESRTGDHRR